MAVRIDCVQHRDPGPSIAREACVVVATKRFLQYWIKLSMRHHSSVVRNTEGAV